MTVGNKQVPNTQKNPESSSAEISEEIHGKLKQMHSYI